MIAGGPNYLLLFLLFVLTMEISLFGTYFFMQFARKNKIMSFPVKRSVHARPVPYLGGLGIYVAFMFALLCIYFFDRELRLVFSFKFQGLLIASSFVVFLGLMDDVKGLSPYLKFLGQILAAVILFMYGFRIEVLTHPFLGGAVRLPFIISMGMTCFWFLGMMNSMNLIDGLDGLAAGITIIVCISLGCSALYLQSYATFVLLMILAGASIGFLPYNYHPARIFMGDAGSLFIGLVLGALALLESQYKSTTATALLVPFVALAIPIIDVFLAIIRRVVGNRPIFMSDKEHLHHRLLKAGLKQNQIVLFLYALTIYLGLFAFLFVLIPERYAFVLLILLTLGIYMGVRVLDFFEKKLRYQKRMLQRRKTQRKKNS